MKLTFPLLFVFLFFSASVLISFMFLFRIATRFMTDWISSNRALLYFIRFVRYDSAPSFSSTSVSCSWLLLIERLWTLNYRVGLNCFLESFINTARARARCQLSGSFSGAILSSDEPASNEIIDCRVLDGFWFDNLMPCNNVLLRDSSWWWKSSSWWIICWRDCSQNTLKIKNSRRSL